MERPARPEPQGSGETEKSPQFDTIITFGQGPVKEVKLLNDLTEEEKKIWNEFKTLPGPRGIDEPNFYVVEKDIDLARKQEMQHTGRFALKRWGKLNALAAGYMLLEGNTQEVIFSGGRTMSSELRNKYRQMFLADNPKFRLIEGPEPEHELDLYIKYMVRFPSEGELMGEITVGTFGRQFADKYNGEKIEDREKIDDESDNSIETLFRMLSEYPELLYKNVGVLSGDYHLERILILADWIGMEARGISAQKTLRDRALRKSKKKYASIVVDAFASEYPKLVDDEKRLISGLVEPQFLEYWGPYLSEIEDPLLFQHVLHKFLKDPDWAGAAKTMFSKVGLDFDKLKHEDLLKLAEQNPQNFLKIRRKLFELTFPGKRMELPGPAIKK